MKRHTRHLLVILAVAVVLIIAAVATGRVHAEDLSGYSGADAYKRFCASCHGVSGRGDGPVAASMRMAIPDLTELARRAGGEFPVERIRRIVDGRTVVAPHGPRDMPVWGHEFRTAQPGSEEAVIDRIVAHLRTLQRRQTPSS